MQLRLRLYKMPLRDIIMKKISLIFLAALFTGPLFAQTIREVSGVVQDSTGTGIIGATVKLAPITGTADTLSTRTNQEGAFVFKDVKTSQFLIIVSSLGYNSVRITSVNDERTRKIILGTPIILKTGAVVLDQVMINGAPPVVMKPDTIEYAASAYKLKENAVAEDLLKRLDGVEVDRNGNVTVQGKPVGKVRLNGKDFFGGDVKTATKNIPAKAIDKVQIVDDYGDQANFTGVRTGDSETIINITTRPGMNRGILANATAGGGNERRYQLSGFGTHILGDRNLGITTNMNNNGAQIGGLGFGGRGGPSGVTSVNSSGGSGGFGASGETGGNSGVTTLSSVGLNYSDRWSRKLTVTGGYYFTSSDNSTISNILSQNVTSKGTIFATTDADRGTDSYAHNMTARIQYSIGPKDQLVISPSVGFTTTRNEQIRSNVQTGVIRQDQLTNSNVKLLTPSIGGNALYTHRFKKAGRNYSLNVGARTNGIDSEDDNINNIKYYNSATNALEKDSISRRLNEIDNQTLLTALRFTYSEPLSKTNSLQFIYNMNYNHYDNNRITNNTAPSGALSRIDSLSNTFDYSFSSHQVGVNYTHKVQANELTIGISANPALLSGSSPTLKTDIHRSSFYLAPILRYTHTYSRTKNMQVNYMSRAGEPTFSQLQPVRDVSDPQRPVVGNPNLNSSFTHSISANYNTSNPQKRNSFLLRLQGSLISDRIVSNIVLIPDAYGSFKREIRYLNSDGTYSYSGTYNWQKSTVDRHYTVRLNGNAGFNRNVSFADNIKNFSGEWSVRQGVGLQINPGTWLEFSPNLSYRYSKTNYTLPTNTDTEIQTWSVDVDGNVFFLKNRSLVWRFTGFKNFNTGYTGALNVNPLVLNTSVEKTFLKDKSATLKLQGFDLFDQANNISRTIMDNGFADISTNRLTQYFMLTLTMRLNKMAGGAGAGAQQRTPGQGRGAGGPQGGR